MISESTVVTNADGDAKTKLTLGDMAGEYTVLTSSPDPEVEPDSLPMFTAIAAGLQILANDNTVIDTDMEALSISNHVSDNALPTDGSTSFGTTNTDPDNFRIEVNDASITGNSLDVFVSVSTPGAIGPPPATTYTLDKQSNSAFRGLFLRMVSDTFDGAASGNGTNTDPDNQTILADLGDVVTVTYNTSTGAKVEKQIAVARPMAENDNSTNERLHDIRETRFNVVVFRNSANTASVITQADLDTIINDTNERLAQAGIQVTVAGTQFVTMANQPADLSDGFTTGSFNPPNADENALLAFKDSDNATVDVFYVDNIIAGNSNPRGIAYPVVRNVGNVPNGNNWTVVNGLTAGPHTLAHELMHILLNSGHRNDASGNPLDPVTALFRTGTTSTKDVGGTKRIGPYPDAATAGVGNNDVTTIRAVAETLPQ